MCFNQFQSYDNIAEKGCAGGLNFIILKCHWILDLNWPAKAKSCKNFRMLTNRLENEKPEMHGNGGNNNQEMVSEYL